VAERAVARLASALVVVVALASCGGRTETRVGAVQSAGDDLLYVVEIDDLSPTWSPLPAESPTSERMTTTRATWQLWRADGNRAAKVAQTALDHPIPAQGDIVATGPSLVVRRFYYHGEDGYAERVVGAATWAAEFPSAPVAVSPNGRYACLIAGARELTRLDRTTGARDRFEVAPAVIPAIKGVKDLNAIVVSDDGAVVAYLVDQTLHALSLAEGTEAVIQVSDRILNPLAVIHGGNSLSFVCRTDLGTSPSKVLPYTTITVLDRHGATIAKLPEALLYAGRPGFTVRRSECWHAMAVLDENTLAFAPPEPLDEGSKAVVVYWDFLSDRTWTKSFATHTR
jgi:hypothetical protein